MYLFLVIMMAPLYVFLLCIQKGTISQLQSYGKKTYWCFKVSY